MVSLGQGVAQWESNFVAAPGHQGKRGAKLSSHGEERECGGRADLTIYKASKLEPLKAIGAVGRFNCSGVHLEPGDYLELYGWIPWERPVNIRVTKLRATAPDTPCPKGGLKPRKAGASSHWRRTMLLLIRVSRREASHQHPKFQRSESDL